MSCNKPRFINASLNNLDHDDSCNIENCKTLATSYNSIREQCGLYTDPIFQDFRFGPICDALDEFKKRGLNKLDLIFWKIIMAALFPWDSDYDIFRQNVNRRFVFFPWVIAMCKTERQVRNALMKAIKYRIPLCIRSGAHCYEPYSLCDGMIIDQSRRTGIKIDKKRQVVTIQSGCLLGPTAYELSKEGLAIASGTCANVGITGLALGGGVGFISRAFGLVSDNLVELTMIDAEGKQLIVNEKQHPDLFWALQGAGGGNFGIVTSLTLKTHPITNVYILELRWSADRLSEVLTRWLEWGPEADRDLTTELDVYAINKSNPLPILITGVYIGKCKDDLEEILKPLFDLDPLEVKIWPTSYIESIRHFTYQRFPAPFFKNKSTYVKSILPGNIANVVIKFMRKAGPNDRLEFNGLGGAYDDKKPDETAYPHRGMLAWIQWICRWGANSDNTKNADPWEDYNKAPEKFKWLFSFYNEFTKEAGETIKGAYVNCPESELEDWAPKYYGNNLPRLLKIKKKWDPNNVFNFPQGLSQLI